MARVPLMPTSQSASGRLRAASARPCNSASLRNLAKPSRIAVGVIDCNHGRLTGCLAFCMLLDQAEDQLSLAPRVAGVHQFGHILALDEPGELFQAVRGLLGGFSSKCVGTTGSRQMSTCHARLLRPPARRFRPDGPPQELITY